MKNKLLFLLLIITSFSYAQLSGTLKYHTGQQLKMFGYNGFKTIELGSTSIDSMGGFTINYDVNYKGMGYLETSDKSQLFIVLNEKQIIVKGTHLKEPDSTRYIKSFENLIFNQYAVEHNQRENALAGWKHVLPQYQTTILLNSQKEVLTTIQNEIERLEKEDVRFLNTIDKTTYVSWFLPLRKLLDDIPLSAQRYINRIPKHLADFRKTDFNNPHIYTSGILDDLIESHYWLIENGGMLQDSMYAQMNTSTDYLIANLEGNDKLLNEIAHFLFSLLEKRSLFNASEYLALKLLTQSSCTLEDDLAKQMETYRAMKVGNTAPDIFFTGKNWKNGIEITTPLTLSEMNTKYTLVVFGASWCPECAKEIPKIKPYYIKWKQKGVEVVLVSLDNEEEAYTKFVKDFPFLSFCDFKSWETQAAKNYYVFSSPTLFLLDKDRKIVLRPNSIEQADAWVDYYIGESKK